MDILPPLSEEDRMLSGLCYPFWPVVPPLVLLSSRRAEPFVHFHALQGLALGVLSTVGTVLLALAVWLTLMVLPGSSPAFSGIVGLGIFGFGLFALFFYLSFLLYTAWRAASGRFLRLPFLGGWAEARMQAHLGLSRDDYSFEPLSRRDETQESEEETPLAEDFDPATLMRKHRVPVRAAGMPPLGTSDPEAPPPGPGRTPARPRQLRFDPAETPGGERPPLDALRSAPPNVPPEERVPVEDSDFQPGLFPAAGRGPSRSFRWEPLEHEDETDEPPAPGSGFQAW